MAAHRYEHVDSVVVLTTGQTSTTGVLPVLAHTAVAVRDVAAPVKMSRCQPSIISHPVAASAPQARFPVPPLSVVHSDAGCKAVRPPFALKRRPSMLNVPLRRGAGADVQLAGFGGSGRHGDGACCVVAVLGVWSEVSPAL